MTDQVSRFAVLALATAASTVAAGQVAPLTHAEFLAIYASLGFRAQPAGLTTVEFLLARDGGRLDLPPRAAGLGLCVTERHYFQGDASTGYSRMGEPFLLYWRPVSAKGCRAETLADISTGRTFVADSIEFDRFAPIIARTEELVELARAFPKCEGSATFWAIMEEPLHIGTIERPSPYRETDGDDDFVATLATVGVHHGPTVRFSLIDDELVLRRVCPSFWSPFAYEDAVWTFWQP